MNIPRFWAKGICQGEDTRGRKCRFVANGWSFASLQEAREEASRRARRVFEIITAGRTPKQYEYLDRPIREEIVREIGDGNAPAAIVTRNRYGALVLNCAGVMFVDVDYPPPRARGLLERIKLAFSPKLRDDEWQAAAKARIEQVEQWAGRNPGRGFRLYRTKEGLRLLFTDRLYDPASDATAATLSELDADPLYVRLTRKQQCFRARLTSKPWRCDCSCPPNAFPWETPEAEAKYRNWQETYAKRDAQYKVCELVREFGAPADNETIKTIVDVHDRETRISADARLA
ncbi:MAG: hypothetical protein PHR35_02385 [Kiritimatiellae bacterium]|nr:hypothetical protein [Kiritimatiellia bacterium]